MGLVSIVPRDTSTLAHRILDYRDPRARSATWALPDASARVGIIHGGNACLQVSPSPVQGSPQRPTNSVPGVLHESGSHMRVGLLSDPSAGVPE